MLGVIHQATSYFDTDMTLSEVMGGECIAREFEDERRLCCELSNKLRNLLTHCFLAQSSLDYIPMFRARLVGWSLFRSCDRLVTAY